MLQAMQKKVAEEAELAEDLHKKFQSNGGDLAANNEAAETKLADLGPAIDAAISKKAQLEKDLASHQEEKNANKAAVDQATALREKEKAAFDKELAENKVNYNSVSKALDALEQGMGGSFLQTGEAGVLRAFLMKKQEKLDGDRQEVLSFLSGEQGGEYAPTSSEILGILKQMKDEMAQDKKDMIATEEAAVKTYGELMKAKKDENRALTKQTMEKLDRMGDLSQEIIEMKNDQTDTGRRLAKGRRFAVNLKKNCGSKEEVYEEEKKMRAQEVKALAETIEVLNYDDALELFKKTLPGAGASFLQLQTTFASMRAQAQNLVSQARSKIHPGRGAAGLDFVALALSGRKGGLDKVTKMVGRLIDTLQQEQDADDHKKEYCSEQFMSARGKTRTLKRTVSDVGTAIEDIKEGIATLTEEIGALKKGIVSLDQSVAEATQQRKAENAEFKETMASSAAARELILTAKSKLDKFYTASLLQATSQHQQQDGDEDDAGDNVVGSSFVQLRKPGFPPPPETMEAYKKKPSGGVLQMIDILIGDIDRQMKLAQREEKNSQEEYQEAMRDSAEKRTIDAKTLSDKQGAKADLESALEEKHYEKKSSEKELQATADYIRSLHSECDWLTQYYSVRKEARTEEIDALTKAKDVLSNSD
eukprot:CAMPEP_0115494284 /NCGR_PEP_ID=MMETSP0271-20121206/64636_1 /TAXON_ID=71861 /ORGANISM="Scrippsiella trochoidea, Strain CCMP3099" /LENGTH=647 /DNA_ID=CAMNT_0002922849 /DNA_START=42 /DNA_END=1985 /DNA_ORIENTATION=+